MNIISIVLSACCCAGGEEERKIRFYDYFIPSGNSGILLLLMCVEMCMSLEDRDDGKGDME